MLARYGCDRPLQLYGGEAAYCAAKMRGQKKEIDIYCYICLCGEEKTEEENSDLRKFNHTPDYSLV